MRSPSSIFRATGCNSKATITCCRPAPRWRANSDIPLNAVRLSDLTKPLAGLQAKAKVAIFDLAHPYPPASAPGLALIEPDPGMLVAMNAAPGTVGPNETGPYGAYAQALAEMIATPGLPIGDVFDQVRLRVAALTKGAEVPWDASRIDQPFVFFAAGPDTPPPPVTAAEIETRRTRPIRDFSVDDAYAAALERDTLQGYEDFLAAYPRSRYAKAVRGLLAARREALTWRRTLDVGTPEAYWSYLRRYPKGPHAAEAREILGQLAAALQPPPDFAPLDYDVPPPPPDEEVYFDAPQPVFYDPDYAPPPPVVVFLPPPPPWWALPPPPRIDRDNVYFLPEFEHREERPPGSARHPMCWRRRRRVSSMASRRRARESPLCRHPRRARRRDRGGTPAERQDGGSDTGQSSGRPTAAGRTLDPAGDRTAATSGSRRPPPLPPATAGGQPLPGAGRPNLPPGHPAAGLPPAGGQPLPGASRPNPPPGHPAAGLPPAGGQPLPGASRPNPPPGHPAAGPCRPCRRSAPCRAGNRRCRPCPLPPAAAATARRRRPNRPCRGAGTSHGQPRPRHRCKRPCRAAARCRAAAAAAADCEPSPAARARTLPHPQPQLRTVQPPPPGVGRRLSRKSGPSRRRCNRTPCRHRRPSRAPRCQPRKCGKRRRRNIRLPRRPPSLRRHPPAAIPANRPASEPPQPRCNHELTLRQGFGVGRWGLASAQIASKIRVAIGR